MYQKQEIEKAKGFLRDILYFDQLKPWQPVKMLMTIAKQNGIHKTAMREARKEMGVISLTGADGQQYWASPERIEFPGTAIETKEEA